MKIVVLRRREHDSQDSPGYQYGAKINAEMLSKPSKKAPGSHQKPTKCEKGSHFGRKFGKPAKEEALRTTRGLPRVPCGRPKGSPRVLEIIEEAARRLISGGPGLPKVP